MEINGIPAKPLPQGTLNRGGFFFFMSADVGHDSLPKKVLEKIERLQKMQRLPGVVDGVNNKN